MGRPGEEHDHRKRDVEQEELESHFRRGSRARIEASQAGSFARGRPDEVVDEKRDHYGRAEQHRSRPDPDFAGVLLGKSGGENGAVLQPDMALKRRITLVLPRIGVFNTTVSRNVAYPLRVRGLTHAEIESRVNKTLAFVGLERKKSQQARTLSSGETQRLGIARALVLDPEILFLDEPTASIDEENTRIIESIIKDMRKEGRAMVIMTTHDNAQAERIADSILVLEHGFFQTEKKFRH